MTKIEIHNQITKFLSSNPIMFKDLLDKTVPIDSYETYQQELTLVAKTFKNIPEFYSETQKHLELMRTFIEYCMTLDDSRVYSHIQNHFKSKFCGSSYNTQITFQALITASIIDTPERNPKALQQIYDELGFENLKHYINLLKSPSNFSNYLNSSEKQEVAMHYLLFKTNHHSSSKLKRDFSIKNFFKLMQENIHSSISEITNQKSDFISFMDNEKTKFASWYAETSDAATELYNSNKAEYESFLSQSKQSFENLRKTYSDHLKLEQPADFMEKQSNKYKKSAIIWSCATVVLAIVLILLLYLILDPHITFTEQIITIHLFSNQMPIYSSVIIFSMIALIIYVLKLFIKMAVSSKHLSEEYYQKYTLTYFYLSLLNEGKLEQQQADIILATLFTKADTGLIKNNNSSDTEYITKLFSMMKSS